MSIVKGASTQPPLLITSTQSPRDEFKGRSEGTGVISLVPFKVELFIDEATQLLGLLCLDAQELFLQQVSVNGKNKGNLPLKGLARLQ